MGCWDLTEIEETGFLLIVGLDPVENEEKVISEYEKETGRSISQKPEHNQMFSATFNVAIPGKIESQVGGMTGKPFFNITTTGLTNFKAVRQIAARRSRKLNFEHVKAIVINEDLVRGGPMLQHISDFYIRDHEMRRRANVYITNKKAKEVLDNKLPLEELIATSILDINENHNAVLSMSAPITIGEVAVHILEESSFIIPRIVPYDGDLKIAGAAIFLGRENTMLGWLGEVDMSGYNWVMGEAKNGIIEVNYKEGKGEFFVFEVITMATKVDYRRKNGKNIFDIKVRAEGSIGDSWLHDVEISDEKAIKELEKLVEEEIKAQANQIIDKMQNEFHADIFDFHTKVKQKQYNYWKSVEDDWDGEGGEFEKAEININTKVKIRHYMLNEKLG